MEYSNQTFTLKPTDDIVSNNSIDYFNHNKNLTFKPLLNLISEIILPNFCVTCQTPGYKICPACTKKIEILEYQNCIICEGLTLDGKTHEACKIQNPYTPTQAVSTYNYTSVVKNLILTAKKNFNTSKLLEVLIKNPNCINNLHLLKSFDFIVPIPPSSAIFKNKSIDHTNFIATEISKITNTPIINLFSNFLNPNSQKSNNRLNRFANVKSMAINPKYLNYTNISDLNQSFYNKQFLIVDDITTSGASILYASYLLKSAGAREVASYTLAKDLLHNRL